MPLLPGKKNIGRNIRELKEHGTRKRSMRQITAIALHTAYGDPKRSHPYTMNPSASKKGGCMICGAGREAHTIDVTANRR